MVTGASEASGESALVRINIGGTDLLAQRKAVAGADDVAALKVGQSEGRDAIAAVGRAYQIKQRRELADLQQLAVTEQLTARSKVPGESRDDPERVEGQSSARKNAERVYYVVQPQRRLLRVDGRAVSAKA